MKKLLCLVLVVTLALSATLTAFATDVIMTLTATYNGEILENNDLISINTSEENREIILAVSEFDKLNDSAPDTTTLQYAYSWDGQKAEFATENENGDITVFIPEFDAGTQHQLQLEAIINDKDNGYIGNSNIITVYVGVEYETAVWTSLSLYIRPSTSVDVKYGTQLMIQAYTNQFSGTETIAFRWDNDELYEVKSNIAYITVPEKYEIGTSHLLRIQAMSEDGTKSEPQMYKVNIVE